jgi:hypothetical protein
MDPGLNKEINKLISGYKKSVGDKKQEGVISCFEGKRPLAFEGYKLLCTMFATLGPGPSHHHQATIEETDQRFRWASLRGVS